jgi:hypothetical protein
MKYRPPATPPKHGLIGSDRDLYRLHTIAQESLEKHPVVAEGFDTIRGDLLEATHDARDARYDVLLAEPAEHKAPQHERVTLSLVLHVLILCAAIAIGAVFLPGKGGHTPEFGSSLAWSIGSAYLTIAMTLVALFLPASGSLSTRRQAWKIDLFGALIGGGSMVVGFRTAGATDELDPTNWTTWLIVTTVAILMVLILTAKTFHSVKSAPQEESEEAPSEKQEDLDYYTSVEPHELHATERADALLDQHPAGRAAITSHWQDSMKSAARKQHISKAAATHASQTLVWHWQIELITSPDYENADE